MQYISIAARKILSFSGRKANEKNVDEKGREKWVQVHNMDTLIRCQNAWNWQDLDIRRPGAMLEI